MSYLASLHTWKLTSLQEVCNNSCEVLVRKSGTDVGEGGAGPGTDGGLEYQK